MNDPERAHLVREVTSLRERIAELERKHSSDRQGGEPLRASEERFRKIFEHSHDAIFLVDPAQDQIIEANSRAASMLGYPREELLSLHISAIHPTEMDRVRAFAESVRESGHGWTSELTCATKGGSRLPAEISASFVQFRGRECMVALVRDISERKKHEAELERYRDRLEELVEERTRELAAANRELRKLRRQLELENTYLREEVKVELAFGEIVGSSPAIGKVLEQIEMVAPTDAGVLIQGETGTGKELVARAIHERSRRRERPMVKVNCGCVPRELFESEFFGHVKGAFTGALRSRAGRFELADSGTLFLDEVGEIPLELQAKLLRVLQEKAFERVGDERSRRTDVRFIAATNRDLEREVEEGRFREDLYYRLSVFPIEVPPLRARGDDIALLARHFLAECARRLNCATCRLTEKDIAELSRYDWPGNVRELQNVIERAVITAGGGELGIAQFLPSGSARRREPQPVARDARPFLPESALRKQERENILAALAHAGGKIYGPGGAAELLGVKPTTLASRMKKHRIPRDARE